MVTELRAFNDTTIVDVYFAVHSWERVCREIEGSMFAHQPVSFSNVEMGEGARLFICKNVDTVEYIKTVEFHGSLA